MSQIKQQLQIEPPTIQRVLGAQGHAGQTMYRNIRPKHPLSSQQIGDIFNEFEADLKAIIDQNINMSLFTSATAETVKSCATALHSKDMATGRINRVQADSDHTAEWRLL